MKDEKKPRISPREILEIKRLERERFSLIDSGKLLHPIFIRPVKVRILILIDSGISFNQFYFGLSEVLDTLYNNPEWWVEFEVTKAHRFTDPNKPAPGTAAYGLYGPDFEDFRFNQAGFNLNDYDQLWLFSFNSNTGFPDGLDTNELEIVYRWMNEKKGGVLAMGDHFTLGAALGSQIPRVRNMRRWTVADGVPSNVGPDRHDSLVKGHRFAGAHTPAVDEGDEYTFDDESDDIPMNVRLKWYYSHLAPGPFYPKHWYWPYKWNKYPHPIFCGAKGPIDILPDHPHEGEVVVPANLTDSPQFNAYQYDEYPFNGAARLKPEVIAWARVQDDHRVSDFKGIANPKEFGAVGAYNGHRVKVGRVVVDSTWHHWFDVNLTGRMFFGTDNPGQNESLDPRKLNGFNDSAAGVAALAKIKNYFRNVAIWLSPPGKINSMAKVALWNSLFKYPLYADLHKAMPVWVIGHHAIDVLGRYAGQCNVRSWWPVLIPELKFEKFFDDRLTKVPNPGLQSLDEFMIGGVLQAMLEQKEAFLSGEKKEMSERELDKIVKTGLARGSEAMEVFLNEISLSERNFKGTFRNMCKMID